MGPPGTRSSGEKRSAGGPLARAVRPVHARPRARGPHHCWASSSDRRAAQRPERHTCAAGGALPGAVGPAGHGHRSSYEGPRRPARRRTEDRDGGAAPRVVVRPAVGAAARFERLDGGGREGLGHDDRAACRHRRFLGLEQAVHVLHTADRRDAGGLAGPVAAAPAPVSGHAGRVKERSILPTFFQQPPNAPGLASLLRRVEPALGKEGPCANSC